MSKYDAPYIANNSLYASGALRCGGFFVYTDVKTDNVKTATGASVAQITVYQSFMEYLLPENE